MRTGCGSAPNNNANLTNEYPATIVNDPFHFTIPVDSTGWGDGDWTNARMTFGLDAVWQVIRLKSSFNVETYCTGDMTTSCPFIKALLRSMQDYGVAAFDGASGFNDDWAVGILSNEFEPPQIVAAAKDITSWTFIEQYMELVDTGGLMANMGRAYAAEQSAGRDQLPAHAGLRQSGHGVRGCEPGRHGHRLRACSGCRRFRQAKSWKEPRSSPGT